MVLLKEGADSIDEVATLLLLKRLDGDVSGLCSGRIHQGVRDVTALGCHLDSDTLGAFLRNVGCSQLDWALLLRRSRLNLRPLGRSLLRSLLDLG